MEVIKNILIRSRGTLKLIPIEAITLFKSDSKYTMAYCNNTPEPYIIEDTLVFLEKRLEGFVRIHRNCLVRVSSIQGITKTKNGKSSVVYCNIKAGIVGEKPIEIKAKVSRRQLPTLREIIKDRTREVD